MKRTGAVNHAPPLSTNLMPEHLGLVDPDKKWDALIKLLQSQRDEMKAIASEIADVRFEQSRMADELVHMNKELQAAQVKLTEFDKLRNMALGGKAVLMAGGGAIWWLLSQFVEYLKHK